MESYKEIFNGEIDNQSPEMYSKVLKLIKRAQELVGAGYDLPLAFDDGVPEVVQFFNDLNDQLQDTAINCYADGQYVRILGDVIDDYGRVISILGYPERAGAEDRLNQIFHKGKYEIKHK
jgi:hypothetical protein